MFGFTPYSQAAYSDDGVVDVVVSLTGVAGAGQVGDAEAKIVAFAAVTGVEATGGVGQIEAPNTGVIPTGVEATGGIGDMSIVGDATLTPIEPLGTGTGQVGSLTMTGTANVSLTGVAATGAVGEVSIAANAVVSPTGLAGTGNVGDVTITEGTGVTVSPTGLEAFMPVGGSAFSVDGDAQISTAQKKFGTASLLLDGTDDFVTSDESIDLSSGDFTVDMWIRPDNVTGYKGLFQSGTSSLLSVYLIGDQVQGTVAGSTTLFISDTRVSANVWTMITVEREGNVHRLYINGTLEESSSTSNRPDNGTFTVGKNGFGDFDGYIDEVRLSSVARYEGTSFTEPTSEFTVDKDTTALLHFNGTNGSTDIINATGVSVTITGDSNASVTGLEATGELGTVTTGSGANVPATGIEATGGVGSVTISADSNLALVGVEADGEVGDITVTGGAVVDLTGVEATGEVTPPVVWGTIVPNPGTIWSEIAA